MPSMTPRERVEAVLCRREADRVPNTAYEIMVPQCETERRLRNEGLCIVNRLIPVFKTETPDVKETVCHYVENGVSRARKYIETPVGNLTDVARIMEIDAPSGTTLWAEEKLFKGPDDYKAIEFMIRNRMHVADYGPLARAQKLAGDDVIHRARVGYEPFQEILITLMGLETFSVEWAERRDEVLKLYHALVEDRRKVYPLVAQSPALHVNYGGNVVSEVVGPVNFEKYLLPDYNECAEVMHKHGKLLGTHLDGNNRLIAPLVARSDLDYVEAFTPAPDTNMTVKEAFDAWPDKVLWIHFPSSVHLESPEVIEAMMLEILDQARPGDRLIVGITEDIPNDHWQKSLSVISRVLNAHGQLPLR